MARSHCFVLISAAAASYCDVATIFEPGARARDPQEVVGRAGLVARLALGLALAIHGGGQPLGEVGALGRPPAR